MSAGNKLAPAPVEQRNQDATIFVGNLDIQVDEELLWELMVQAGPIASVFMPKDPVSGQHRGFGFVEFRNELDAEYAVKVMNMVKLFGKPTKVNKSAADRKTLDVGANLFVGNLDPEVDEKLLYDTFSAFGGIIETPHIAREFETGASKGYGFVKFDNFESADAAIEAMHGQYLANRAISVQYAFKQDSPGERHGTQAERLLAASRKRTIAPQLRPHTRFAAAPGEISSTQNQNVPLSQQARFTRLQPPPLPASYAPPLPANAVPNQTYNWQGYPGQQYPGYGMMQPPPVPTPQWAAQPGQLPMQNTPGQMPYYNMQQNQQQPPMPPPPPPPTA